MKRYFHAVLYALLTVILGYVMFFATGNVCRWLYEALKDWFPAIFEDYSPVLDAEKFERAEELVLMLGAVLALFLSSLIVTRLDNGRDEYITRTTEGFYRIGEVLPDYYRRYTLPDLFATLFSTALISVPIILAWDFVPEKIDWFSNSVLTFKSFHIGMFYGRWGYVLAPIFVFAVSFASKMLSGISGLKRWRAAWLTYN